MQYMLEKQNGERVQLRDTPEVTARELVNRCLIMSTHFRLIATDSVTIIKKRPRGSVPASVVRDAKPKSLPEPEHPFYGGRARGLFKGHGEWKGV